MSLKLCTHVKSDGAPCQAIAVTDSPYCYFHRKHYHPAGMPGQRNYRVPLLESHHAIQLAATDLYQSFVTGIIPLPEARFALQVLRLASRTVTEIERDARKEALGTDNRVGTDSRVRAAAPGCAESGLVPEDKGTTGAPFKPAVGLSGVVPDGPEKDTVSVKLNLNGSKPQPPNPFVNAKPPQSVKSLTDVDLAPLKAELDRVKKPKEAASK